MQIIYFLLINVDKSIVLIDMTHTRTRIKKKTCFIKLISVWTFLVNF